MEWISVKDRLPKNNQYLIFIYNDEYCHEILPGYYDEIENKWRCSASDLVLACIECNKMMAFDTDSITYWMPLPPPPNLSCTEIPTN